MAIVFERLSLKGLRRTHLEQLLYYIEQQEIDGTHYGNRDQFQKRHRELKRWVGDAVKYASSDGVVFPK